MRFDHRHLTSFELFTVHTKLYSLNSSRLRISAMYNRLPYLYSFGQSSLADIRMCIYDLSLHKCRRSRMDCCRTVRRLLQAPSTHRNVSVIIKSSYPSNTHKRFLSNIIDLSSLLITQPYLQSYSHSNLDTTYASRSSRPSNPSDTDKRSHRCRR